MYAMEDVSNDYGFEVDISEVCVDDPFEPNNEIDMAFRVGSRSYESLMMCSNDDWYSVALNEGGSLDVRITFDGSLANIDIEFYTTEYPDPIDTSYGTEDQEHVTVVATITGLYYIRVLPVDEAHIPYRMSITIVSTLPCSDDYLEENDSSSQARLLYANSILSDLKICPQDDDWYYISLDLGDSLFVYIDFNHSIGNTDAELYSPSLSLIQRSSTDSNHESLSIYDVADQGSYFVRIYGVGEVDNLYDLSVWVERDLECYYDQLEPNDSPSQVAIIDQGQYSNLQICPTDDDWYAVHLDAGQSLIATISFDGRIGYIDMELYIDPYGPMVDHSYGVGDSERVSIADVTTDGLYYIRIFLFDGDSNFYTMEIGIYGGCDDDWLEPNHNPSEAKQVQSHTSYPPMVICPNDEDWYTIQVGSGDFLEVKITFHNEDGNLDLELYAPNAQTLIDSSTTTQNEETVGFDEEEYGAGVYFIVCLELKRQETTTSLKSV
jgi:hypothetical protein